MSEVQTVIPLDADTLGGKTREEYEQEIELLKEQNTLLKEIIGSVDISSMGYTVTEAISVLNTNLDNKVAKTQFSNPNLLDNPWFTVNQRGDTTLSAVGWLVDRWWMGIDIGTLNVVSDGLEIDATNNSVTFKQGMELNALTKELVSGNKSKTITLDITIEEIGTGNVNVYSNANKTTDYNNNLKTYGIIHNSDVEVGKRYLLSYTMENEKRTFSELNNYNPVWLYFPLGWKVILHAVKLELGSISTLAMDTAPNYAEEVMKCSTSKAEPSDPYANKPNYVELISNFQAGVDKIYNACVSAGSTPSSKSADDCVTAIGNVRSSVRADVRIPRWNGGADEITISCHGFNTLRLQVTGTSKINGYSQGTTVDIDISSVDSYKLYTEGSTGGSVVTASGVYTLLA